MNKTKVRLDIVLVCLVIGYIAYREAYLNLFLYPTLNYWEWKYEHFTGEKIELTVDMIDNSLEWQGNATRDPRPTWQLFSGFIGLCSSLISYGLYELYDPLSSYLEGINKKGGDF